MRISPDRLFKQTNRFEDLVLFCGQGVWQGA